MRQQAIHILTAHNIRPSEQRIAILQYLLNHPTHPTADTIYEHLHPTMPTLSRTTVYNTLRSLTDSQAVRMLTTDDKNTRYDADTTPHSHLRCTRCGRLFDIPQTPVRTTPPKGFRIDTTQTYHTGLCPDCNTTQTETDN